MAQSSEFKIQNSKYLVYLNLLLIIGLFSLELSLAIPFILFFYLLVWLLHFQEISKLKLHLVKILVPQTCLIVSWFSLNKIFLGSVVGHYGTAIHFNFSPILIFGNAFKYLTKYLFFQRYWEHNFKMNIWSYFDKPFMLFSLVSLNILLLVLAFIYFRKLSTRFRLIGLFLLLFFMALLPVVNLYFYVLQYIENDRYGYVASIFFSLLLALTFFGLPKILRTISIAAWLSISIFFTFKTNIYWQKSTKVHTQLLKKFDFYNEENIVVLNVPENVHGAPILWTPEENHSTIKESLPLRNHQAFLGNITEVAYHNLTDINDGVHIKVEDNKHLRVTFNQWGTWFWRKGNGATNYKNELYEVKFNLNFYDLYLHQVLPNTIFIYWDGKTWQQVDWDNS